MYAIENFHAEKYLSESRILSLEDKSILTVNSEDASI
jgi:hypothetical protein